MYLKLPKHRISSEKFFDSAFSLSKAMYSESQKHRKSRRLKKKGSGIFLNFDVLPFFNT